MFHSRPGPRNRGPRDHVISRQKTKPPVLPIVPPLVPPLISVHFHPASVFPLVSLGSPLPRTSKTLMPEMAAEVDHHYGQTTFPGAFDPRPPSARCVVPRNPTISNQRHDQRGAKHRPIARPHLSRDLQLATPVRFISYNPPYIPRPLPTRSLPFTSSRPPLPPPPAVPSFLFRPPLWIPPE